MSVAPGERLVVDASVAVKWVVDEPDSSRAEALLGHDLFAPDLLFPECANILWKKIRRGELTRRQARIAAQGLEDAELTVIASRGYVALASEIAAELDHPAYDGLYLAVAETLGLRLVTDDGRLVRRLSRAPDRFSGLAVPLSEIG
jgi:predicted nucleic acid-binding protein